MSRFWSRTFRVQYALLALVDPLVRRVWRRFGIGNVIELCVERRTRPGERSRLVGLLRSGGREYVGHPNGHVGWTRDLLAAGSATLVMPRDRGQRTVHAELLADGEERTAAILSTGQHPFPGNLVYRLGRGHIRKAGVFFRLSPMSDEAR